MTILHSIKELALKAGVEVNWYIPGQSDTARLFKLLDFHKIDTVIDVGANDGGYGKALRRGGYSDAILSFEPLESAHVKLVHASRGDVAWEIAPRMAIGSSNGEIEINVAGNSYSSSILPMQSLHEALVPQSRYVGTEKVPLNRLDAVAHPFIEQSNNLLLKIDTQGYELPVLEGAESLLKRVRGIQLEMSLVPLYEGQMLYKETIDWLEAKGFELWSVMPGFVDRTSGRMLQMDGVFFRVQS
ncbi:FkbM family methyltransferase [Methylotenera sp.]|uniref:FkbM family methyltransferase n=1 Tax=Methylotenera sp. TaxID=2051956 RepID=UPI0027307EB1|nr:FkbM family methyltransferase [Methylotenera sp.]MDP2231493.1 FkbM family methyltransferase [Methylotenera sp.]